MLNDASYAEMKINVDENIQRKVQKVLNDFWTSTNKRPLSLMLGPLEYLSLRFSMRDLHRYGPVGIGEVTHFMGHEVRVKSGPGIEIEIDPRHCGALLVNNLIGGNNEKD